MFCRMKMDLNSCNNKAVNVLFVICNYLATPTINNDSFVPVRHLMRIWALMANVGIRVHVITPYRPSIVPTTEDNPMYSSSSSSNHLFHSVDVLVSRLQEHFNIDAMDVWKSQDVGGVQVCEPRLFQTLVHFLIDELKESSSSTNVIMYDPQPTDLYATTHALIRQSERWVVYDGRNMPRACFPKLSENARSPYMGQRLIFVVNITASATPWWVNNVATAVRLSHPNASLVALFDMPKVIMDEMVPGFPKDVNTVHCVSESDKKKWYARAFACVHMGQGEDDQALFDIIGHGVPVIVNRSEHHIGMLGKSYPLFALRPDIQHVRKCVDRIIKCSNIYKQGVSHIQKLQNTSYSYDSIAKEMRLRFVQRCP